MTDARATTELDAHDLQWRCVGEFAETLPLVDLDRVRRPGELPPGELVKDNTVRTVARLPDPVDPDGPGLYVKRYKFRDLAERLKHLVRPTKPEVEWRVCRALQEAGVPTCDVLAIAVRRRGMLAREGFLISREVAGTRSLPDHARERSAEPDGWAPGQRPELLGELAALTASLVDRGFCHTDYHAGNVLIRPGAPAGRRLFVVDHHSIRLRRPRGRRLLRMLGMMGRSLGEMGFGAGEHRAFMRVFMAFWEHGPGASRGAVRRWSALVASAERRLHRTHVRSRTRRCLKSSSMFTSDRVAGFVIHRRRDLPAQVALDVLREHWAAVAGEVTDAVACRKGRRTEVSICPCPSVPPFDAKRPALPERLAAGRVCVKAFRRRPLLARLKDILRHRGRARTAWLAAHGCHVRGVPAARPLALLESRWKLTGAPDYLVTEALANDGSLFEVTCGSVPGAADRRALGRALARLMCLMAEEEVYHPDTKPTNCLVKRVAGEFRVWMVDLDRTRFGVRWTRALWVKCLARLNAGLPANITLLDRMRCLRECSRGRWPAAERLQMARRIYRRSLSRRTAWHIDVR